MKLKKITQEEWDEKVCLHEMWLSQQNNGQILDLEGYDLSKIVFKKNIDLRFIILNKCNLKGVRLEGANLTNN